LGSPNDFDEFIGSDMLTFGFTPIIQLSYYLPIGGQSDWGVAAGILAATLARSETIPKPFNFSKKHPSSAMITR
jgi:hypothetical protein